MANRYIPLDNQAQYDHNVHWSITPEEANALMHPAGGEGSEGDSLGAYIGAHGWTDAIGRDGGVFGTLGYLGLTHPGPSSASQLEGGGDGFYGNSPYEYHPPVRPLYDDPFKGTPFAGKGAYQLGRMVNGSFPESDTNLINSKLFRYDPQLGWVTPTANTYAPSNWQDYIAPVLSTLFLGGIAGPALGTAMGTSAGTGTALANTAWGAAQGQKPGVGTLLSLAGGMGGFNVPSYATGTLNALGSGRTPGWGTLAGLAGGATGFNMPSGSAQLLNYLQRR